MKRLITLILIICGLHLSAKNWEKGQFDLGVSKYENKQYEEALSYFQTIEDQQIINQDLFINIGNCYFRMNKIGLAILYYSKALKIDPTNKIAKKNLDYALSQTIDEQKPESQDALVKIISSLYNAFSINTLAWISFIFFVFIILIINSYFIIYKNKDKLIPNFLLTIFIILFIFTGSLTIHKWEKITKDNEAVLVVDTEIGYSGPGKDFTRVFTIHEGMLFDIIKENGEWASIQLKNGLSGWIKKKSLRKVSIINEH